MRFNLNEYSAAHAAYYYRHPVRSLRKRCAALERYHLARYQGFPQLFVASWRRKVPASLSRRFTVGKRYHLDESRCQQAADKSCFYLKEIWRERDLTGGDLPYTPKLAGARRSSHRAPPHISRPVSRVLLGAARSPAFAGTGALRVTAIPLGRRSPGASSNLPGRPDPDIDPDTACAGRAVPIRSCSRWGLPCRRRCRRRGALLPHLFTLTAADTQRAAAVSSLWHFP